MSSTSSPIHSHTNDYQPSTPIPSINKSNIKKIEKTPTSRLHLLRKCTENSPPAPTKRRVTSFSENLSPSIQADPLTAADLETQKEMAKEHAYMRIQLFYMTVVAMSRIAVRSDGTVRENLQVKVHGARLQHGQGTGGRHAAHDNAAAGVSDKIKKMIIAEILDEKFYTPQKKKLLQNRGFNEETLDQLLKLTTNETDFLEFFYEVWPSRGRQPESILEDTDTDLIVSGTTTEVPRLVNLVCDKRLENAIRDIMCDIYTDVLQGKISPEDATIKYHGFVQNHFETAIPNIKQRISDLKTYAKNLKVLSDSTRRKPDSAWQQLIEKSVQIKKRLKDNNHKGSPTVLFRKVGYLFQKNRKTPAKDMILSIKMRVKENYDKIVEQISTQKEKLEQLLEFTRSECIGTILPPFELLKNTDKNAPGMQEPDEPVKRPKRATENESVASEEPLPLGEAPQPRAASVSGTSDHGTLKKKRLTMSPENEENIDPSKGVIPKTLTDNVLNLLQNK